MENKEQKALDRIFWATVGAVAAVILFAALLLGFSLPGVHRFHGIMGFDGYYRDVHITKTYIVRTYYTGSPLLRNGYPIGMNYGFEREISEYAADLDGDGITELVCNTGMSAAQVGSVCAYKAADGVVWQGTFPLAEMGIVRDEARDTPLVYLRYAPETRDVSVSYTTLPGYENAPTSLDMEGLKYQIWSYCK